MNHHPVGPWLVRLSTCCVSNLPPHQAQAILEEYVPKLIAKYSPQLFTDGALEHVASQSKFFPSYGEICERLGEYERKAPSAHMAIASDDFAEWDTTDHHWLGYYARRRDEGFHRQPNAAAGGRNFVMSLIRQQSRKAADYIYRSGI